MKTQSFLDHHGFVIHTVVSIVLTIVTHRTGHRHVLQIAGILLVNQRSAIQSVELAYDTGRFNVVSLQ